MLIWEYENPSAEKMSYRGRIPDIQKPGDGFQHAAYRAGGEETPGAEIRAEAVMTRATMRGTAEGSRIGTLAAFHELEDEKRRGAGGGVVPAAYHPGEGTGAAGGLGGGYGGLGGGAGGGLGGGASSSAPGGAETAPSGRGTGGSAPSGEHPLSAHAAAMRKQFGHPSKGGAPAEHQAAQRGESQEVVDYIRNSAKRAGIDPNQALRVARSEALRGFDPATGKWSSGSNDAGTSFGPFQAHFKSNIPGYRAAGQGDDMLKAGIDARKMGDWKKAVDWQLDYAHKHGWGEWHGWTGDRWAGINRGAVPEGSGRTAEQHQALIETAKKANPATLGALSSGSKPGTETGYGKGTPPPIKVVGNAIGNTATVDQDLITSLSAANTHLPPGYAAEIFSGHRNTPDVHGRGLAADIRLRKDGVEVPGKEGRDITGMYTKYARSVYGEMLARNPDKAARMAWGGSFGTQLGGGGPSDNEHFDVWKRRGGVRASHSKQIQDLGPMPLIPERPAELAKKPPVEVPKKPPADIHQRAQSLFGHPHMQRADLLGNARKAGMMGNQSQKVTGEASMRIDLRGFPKGTKTKTEMSGMFSQIRVARGRAMPLANQDS